MPSPNLEKRLLQNDERRNNLSVVRFDEERFSFSTWQKVILAIPGIIGIITTLLSYFEGKIGFSNSVALVMVLGFIIYVPYIILWSISLSVNKALAISIDKLEEVIQRGEDSISGNILPKEIRAIESAFEEMITRHDETITSKFQQMITTHDGVITKRFEDMISKHDEIVTSKFEEMISEVEEKVDKIEFPKEKFDRLKTKYDVDLRPVRVQEYEDLAGFHRVKIGLITGVEDSVFATYIIERYSPLPLETEDEANYFNGNKEAFKRIKAKHQDDLKKHAIHRIFIISQEALEKHERRHEIPSRIEQHEAAGFSVSMVMKEDLDDQLRLEFAIFDDEIVFELRIGESGKGFRKGTIYFDEAIVQSVYKERWREIESRSCSPAKFWRMYSPGS